MELDKLHSGSALSSYRRQEDGASSVLNPPAQSSKVCAVPTGVDSVISVIQRKIEPLVIMSNPMGILIELQLFNGCRISSLLSISWNKINSFGQCYVVESKGSHNRLISSPSSVKYLLQCRRRKIDPFMGISRFAAYRYYKKLGIGGIMNNNVNSSVTHYLRHLALNQINDVSESVEDTARLAGHKNVKSTRYYVKQKG